MTYASLEADSNASKLICCLRTDYPLKNGVSNTDPGDSHNVATLTHAHPNASADPDPTHNALRRLTFQLFALRDLNS